ncbi:hypothetical protein LXA47_11010 [Massilia sp. P8910]|nr:hypothetical protein [Massilia antarctica]MCE3604132.1 hypothetical protein [Massilia antarctica]
MLRAAGQGLRPFQTDTARCIGNDIESANIGQDFFISVASGKLAKAAGLVVDADFKGARKRHRPALGMPRRSKPQDGSLASACATGYGDVNGAAGLMILQRGIDGRRCTSIVLPVEWSIVKIASHICDKGLLICVRQFPRNEKDE